MNKQELTPKIERVKDIIGQIRDQYGAVWRYYHYLVHAGKSFENFMQSEPVTRLLRLVNSGDTEKDPDDPVMTVLIPVDQQERFVLLPDCFSAGWNQQRSSFIKDVTQIESFLPPDVGIVWYGTSLFRHRSFFYNRPGRFTSCDYPFREITACEFLLKGIMADLARALAESESDLDTSVRTIIKKWTGQVRVYWDSNRIPEMLQKKVHEEFRYFSRIDWETLVQDARSFGFNEGETHRLQEICSRLFIHYQSTFSCLHRLDSKQLLNGSPGSEALKYIEQLKSLVKIGSNDRVPQDLWDIVGALNAGGWIDWLCSSSLLWLAEPSFPCGRKKTHQTGSIPGEGEGGEVESPGLYTVGTLVQRLDMRLGPLSEALHLQNLRIAPISMMSQLMGLEVSWFCYNKFRQLEAVSLEHIPRQEGIFSSIYSDVLKDFFMRCIYTVVEEKRDAEADSTIIQQKEIISGDSIRLFSRLSPDVLSTEDLFTEYPAILGRSASMKEVFRRIRKVAHTREPVLLLGETGTGKELVAQAIHELSSRRKNKMVILNSAAIPEELIESELFGHEKGAFTGATAMKRGKFEQANGSTLFLDEIGDMSLKTQARILRIIQEQRFERVGGHKTFEVNVRFITATHKNLLEMISINTFREDLFYRLNVYPIILPLLRDRTEDIPLLTVHFVLQKQAELNQSKRGRSSAPTTVNVNTITPEALVLLMEHSWPGHVRELRNLINHILVEFIGEERDCIERDDVIKAFRFLERYQSGGGNEYTRKLLIPRETLVGTYKIKAGEDVVEGKKVSRGGLPKQKVKAASPAGKNTSKKPESRTDSAKDVISRNHSDIAREVDKWITRFAAGIKLDDHKEIYQSYGKIEGMRIYLALFEVGKQSFRSYRKFISYIGLQSQHSAIRNKLFLIRKKLREN